MSLPTTEPGEPAPVYLPWRSVFAAARWALAGAACAGGLWAAGVVGGLSLLGGGLSAEYMLTQAVAKSFVMAASGALSGLLIGYLVGNARKRPGRSANGLALGLAGALLGSVGGSLTIPVVIACDPWLSPLASSSLLWASVGLIAGLGGFLWSGGIALAVEPDEYAQGPAQAGQRRFLTAVSWAFASALCAGGVWSAVLIAARYFYEVSFLPDEPRDGATGSVIVYAALGAVYGLLTGAIVGFLRGGNRPGLSSLVLGINGAAFGAIGGGCSVVAVALTHPRVHPILSSSIAWALVGLLIGFFGYLGSRVAEPDEPADDLDVEDEPVGPKVEWLLREPKRQWRDRSLLRVLPVLIATAWAFAGITFVAPSDTTFALFAVGVLGISVALVLYRQEARLEALERQGGTLTRGVRCDTVGRPLRSTQETAVAREPIPTWCYALVVVRKGDRFLLIQESKYGEPWYLPGGRVEAGETFAEAAVREAREEAGIPVRVTGIIRIEHSPTAAGARMRVVFLAEPTDDTPPKSEPDDESLRAAWVALDELGGYALRGNEVTEYFQYVAGGGTIHPPELLRPEGTPLRTG